MDDGGGELTLVSCLIYCLGILPLPVQALVLGFLALLVIILIGKIVAFVLNAIPFL